MSETMKTKTQDCKTKPDFRDDEQTAAPEQGPGEEPLPTAAKFREASYVVLFIAAVFVVNAMETGSYRTPWPVAIITLLAGLGLFGYSWHVRKKE